MTAPAWNPDRALRFLDRWTASLRETADSIERGKASAADSEDDLRLFLEFLGLDEEEIEASVAEAQQRSCRACGCTEDDCSDCIALTGAPCSWVPGDPDLCSACQTEPSIDVCLCDPPPADAVAADPLAHPEGCPYRELSLRVRAGRRSADPAAAPEKGGGSC